MYRNIFHSTVFLLASILLIPAFPSAAKDLGAGSTSVVSIEKICREVELIRGLKFKKKVNTAVQSREQFKAYVDKEIVRQYETKEKFSEYCRALVKIGALKQDMDFAQVMSELYMSQAAAHYDPASGTYYLLMTDMDGDQLDMIASHELCHALQDQHYSLTNLLEENKAANLDNQDQQYAKQALCEGDATLVMLYYTIKNSYGEIAGTEDTLNQTVSLAARMQAQMGFDGIYNLADSGIVDSAGMMGKQMEDIRKSPRFFMDMLVSAYLHGSVLVDDVRKADGWKAVDKLFADPPQSSEQILHPSKYIASRDNPVDVRIKDISTRFPPGWKMVEEDVMGEMGISALFKVWPEHVSTDISTTAKKAAAGWGGDRYYHLENDSGKSALVWKTVWDNPGDTVEFADAYSRFVNDRFEPDPPKVKSVSGGKAVTAWKISNDRYITIKADTNGLTAVIVDAPEKAFADKF